MKTLFTIISLLAFTLCVTACRDQSPKTDDAAPPPAETAQATPEPAPQDVTEATEAPQKTDSAEPDQAKYDFRHTNWGMSMEEVMQIEYGEPVYKDEDTLEYRGNVMSELARINFKFADDKLVRGGYVFTEDIKDNNRYIEIYNKAKKALIEGNGPPQADAEKQLNPDAEIDPDNIADAICRGDMIYGSQWTREDGTVIRLILNGDNSRCRLVVIYHSPGNVPVSPDQTDPER